MLIEELQKIAGPAPLPAFDPAQHAKLYKAQPKERRRVVNALYRAGGAMDSATLLAQTQSSLDTLRALSDLGLIALLPSAAAPARAILPLERLFATPLAENEADKLVEALKVYPTELLWTLCSVNNLAMNGAIDVELRARLYRWAMTDAPLANLGPPTLEILGLLRKNGWSLEGDRFFRTLGLRLPAGGRSAATLFAAHRFQGGAVDHLLHRLLVIPVRVAPGDSYYHNLAVPRELRPRVEERLAACRTAVSRPEPSAPADPPRPRAVVKGPSAEACVSGKPLLLDSREGLFPGELARLLLLAEGEPISVTQKRTLNRRDVRRLTKSWMPDEAQVERLLTLAVWMGCFETDGEMSRVSSGAAGAVAGSAESLARAVLRSLHPFQVDLAVPWIPESAWADLHRAALRQIRRTLPAGSPLCVHCMARSLAQNPEFSKPLGRATWVPSELAERLIREILGFLHHAGIVTVHRDDGRVVAAAVTPTGRAALSDDPGPPPAAPAQDAELVVQPNGEVIAPRTLDFEELRRLARAAEVKGADAAVVFALTRPSLLRAAQRGEDLAALKALLERRSKTPVPQTVRFQIDELIARQGEIQIFPCAAVVTVRDPSILKALGPDVKPLNDTSAILPAGIDPEEIVARARKLGLLPRMPNPEPALSGGAMKKGEILDELDYAFELDLRVRLALRDGRNLTAEVEEVDDDLVIVADPISGRESRIPLKDILHVRTLEG